MPVSTPQPKRRKQRADKHFYGSERQKTGAVIMNKGVRGYSSPARVKSSGDYMFSGEGMIVENNRLDNRVFFDDVVVDITW